MSTAKQIIELGQYDSRILIGKSPIAGEHWMRREVAVTAAENLDANRCGLVVIAYRDSGPNWADQDWTIAEPGTKMIDLRFHPEAEEI